MKGMMNVKKSLTTKILSVILATILLFSAVPIAGFSTLAKGEKAKVTQTPTKYKYIKYWGTNESVSSPNQRGWETFYKRTLAATGEPAYCLEFGKEFTNGLTTDVEELTQTPCWNNAGPANGTEKSIDNAQKGVTLTTLYGYPNQYTSYGDAAYFATQVLIWEFMMGYRTAASETNPEYGLVGGYSLNNKAARFLIGIREKNQTDIYTVYCSILKDIARHRKPLRLKNEDGDLTNQLILKETMVRNNYEGVFDCVNDTISEYTFKNLPEGMSIRTEGNKLHVYSDKPLAGPIQIEAVKTKTDKLNTGVALYVRNDIQTLIYGTLSDPVSKKFTVLTEDLPTGTISISKNSEDGILGNHKFKITSDNFEDVAVTNGAGDCSFINLPLNQKYVIEEVLEPDSPYKPIPPQTIYLTADNSDVMFMFNNKLKETGEIEILKTSEDNQIQNVGFKITAPGYEKVVYTDASGYAKVTGLDLHKKYKVEELYTEDTPYEKLPVQSVTLNSSSVVRFIFKNTLKVTGKIEIQKTSEDGKISGIEFKVYDAKKNFLKTVYTNEEGIATVAELPLNVEYFVEEVFGPDSPYVNLPVQKIKLTKGNHQVKFLFKNTLKKGSVTVTKLDKESHTPIPDVTFVLIKGDYTDDYLNHLYANKTGRTEFPTGKNGSFKITNLPQGKYTLLEIKPAEGYMDEKVMKTFEITPQNLDVEFVNDSAISNQKTYFEIRKTDSENNPLENVKFEIINKTSNTIIGEFTTNAAGKIILKGLPVGDYIAREVQTQKGYVLPKNNKTEFHISDKKSDVNYVTITNEPLQVVLKKVDSYTDLPLKNAVFHLEKFDGNKFVLAGLEPFTTNNDGEILIKTVYNSFVLEPNTKYRLVEDNAPDGYYTDTTPVDFILNEQGQITSLSQMQGNKLVVKNVRTSFTILKTDSVTRYPVPNAKFEIRNADTNVLVGTYLTNSEGKIVLEGLKEGKYVAKEVGFPQGFIQLPIELRFTIGLDSSKNVTAENNPTVVTLTKVDAQTHAPLAGATIEIYNELGQKVASETTDSNGKITVKYLPVGTYTYKEVVCPDKYQLNKNVYTFTINPDGTISNAKEILNEPTEIVIKKVNDKNEALSNSKIEVYNENGDTVFSGLTNDKGTVTLKYLPFGKYSYKEVSSPSGYKLNKTVYHFEVKTDGSIVSDNPQNTIVNEPTSVTILKADALTNKPLSDAKIEVRNSNGDVVYTGVTDDNGTVVAKNLPSGDYTYKEIVNPDKYQINNSVYSFSINEEGNVTETETILNQPTELVVTKTDSEGNLLKDATIEVYTEEGQLFTSGITDENGQVAFKYLPFGKYYYCEAVAPSGYQLNREKYAFEVKTDGSVISENLENKILNEPTLVVLSKIDELTGEPVKGATLEVYNENQEVVYTGVTDEEGLIRIEKLPKGNYTYKETVNPNGYELNDTIYSFVINCDGSVENDSAVTNRPTEIIINKVNEDGNPLEGAVIGIFNEENEKIFSAVTDENGQAIIKYLPFGNLYYKEISPPVGYKLNSTEFHFEVKTDGSVVSENEENVIVDETTNVEILKVNEEKMPLEGTKIAIENEEGEVVFEGITNEFGKVSVNKLPAGNYKYYEVENPDGYVLDENKYSFTIDNEGNLTEKLVLTNVKTAVEILKVNKENKPLENTTFGVFNAEDEMIATVVTDENGKAVVYGLLSGEYYFKEILPTDGYEISEEKIPFTIERNGHVTSDLTFVNELTTVVVKKTNENGEPLSNAKIGIYDSNNKLVFEGVTNENGLLIIRGLKQGTYTAVELEAPKGYELSTEKISFEINELGIANGEIIIKNMPVSIPKTGRDTDLIETILYTTLVGSMAVMALFGFKKKEKETELD